MNLSERFSALKREVKSWLSSPAKVNYGRINTPDDIITYYDTQGDETFILSYFQVLQPNTAGSMHITTIVKEKPKEKEESSWGTIYIDVGGDGRPDMMVESGDNDARIYALTEDIEAPDDYVISTVIGDISKDGDKYIVSPSNELGYSDASHSYLHNFQVYQKNMLSGKKQEKSEFNVVEIESIAKAAYLFWNRYRENQRSKLR